jgi:nitrogen fixation NifU-like protein
MVDMARYTDLVLEHFQHPRNVGEITDADARAEVSNPVCGDTLLLTARIVDGRIAETRFKARGCGAAIAASSVTTELILGKTLEDLLAIRNQDVAQALGGLPRAKLHCSVLAEEALRALVADYRRRQAEAAAGRMVE